jgi:hypothetical protein
MCAAIGLLGACGGGNPTAPTGERPNEGRATVLISYRASTRARTDLPQSAQTCITGVGETHVHASWRDYDALRAAAAERWELPLNDAPVRSRLSLLIHDGNACDLNATGAATHNVYVNDVLLVQTVTVTTSSGPEPALAFSVDASGRVTP